LFSRHVPSSDWHLLRPPSGGGLRALIVIANPTDLDMWQPEGQILAPLEVAGELERARTALGGFRATILCSDPSLDSAGPPTLGSLYSHLRDGYDIVYLVCHAGLSSDGRPGLWLEDGDGQANVVSLEDQKTQGLSGQLARLRELPPLVVLPSCQVPGETGEVRSSQTRALMGAGVQLIQAGIPAVVTMQSSIGLETAAQFMPFLFQELGRDGLIDRAMAVARRAVRDSADWWVPVLLTRLSGGRLFAGVAEAGAGRSGPEIGGYDLQAIRELMLAAFSRADLRRLFRYTSNRNLRPLAEELGPKESLPEMVDLTIEYCAKRLLLPDLLEEVKRENPRQYSRYEPRLRAR
jgi:hypothetical protein